MESPNAPWCIDGALLERVDQPTEGLYAFSLLSGAERWVLLLAVGGPRRWPAWALASERPRGDPADPRVRGLREKLEGGRIHRFFLTRSSFGFEVQRGEVRWWVDGDRQGLSCSPPIEGVLPEGEPLSAAALREASGKGEALLAEQRSLLAEDARREVEGLLRRARERLRRRAAAIERDLGAVEAAEAKARFASLFVPAAAAASPGQPELRAIDWSSGEAAEALFPLDPAKSALEQLEATFARAKRLRAGASVAHRRRDDALLGVLLVDEALASLPSLPDRDAVRAAVAKLATELPGDARLVAPSQRAARRDAPSRPFRRYEGTGGHPILVGRDAASNDELTLHIARPADLWLHARGRPGAHVIVQGWRVGASELLLDAATLAAHFSDARGEDRIEVQYAERRHVRKRRGSAPGEVEVSRERVLPLRFEPARLARLLATCDRDVAGFSSPA